MKRSLGVVVALLLIVLLGCEQQPPAQPTFVTGPTMEALASPTPSTTPTPAPPTGTPPPPTSTPTPGPSPTPSPSPIPSPTPMPPPPTPNPALADLSYCGGSFGEGQGERFSARLQEVALQSDDLVERLTLTFETGEGRLHGQAHCLLPENTQVLSPTGQISSVLRLELPAWEHDQRFLDSAPVLEARVPVTDTQVIRQAALRVDADRSAGLSVELGLSQLVPFQARVSGNQIIVEVARAPQAPFGLDPLAQSESSNGRPAEPMFLVQGGDLWRLDGTAAAPVTTTVEVETAMAVSPDGGLLAFCRSTAPEAGALGSLWVSRSDGSQARQLADVGGCADPAFSPHGDQLFFVAPITPTPPFVFQLWSVPVEGGAPRLFSGLDEWSRRRPQPLADGSVLSLSSADPNRRSLLLDRPNGTSRDLSIELLGLGAYSGVGRALLAPDGRTIAAEALRAGGGADLVLLDLNGRIQATIGDQAYWNRPLAWNRDGTLFYLSTTCASGVVLPYEIYARSAGQDQLLLTGMMTDDIGAATASDGGVALVRQQPALETLRGPQPEPLGPASVWQLSAGGTVTQLHSSSDPITALGQP